MNPSDRSFQDVLSTPAVWHPSAPRNVFCHVLFRNHFQLRKQARSVYLWVTASQRFILYLDGKMIARGPARGCPGRWFVSRIRVPVMAKGMHTIAARVVHYGRHGGKGQLGGEAFFLLRAQGRGVPEALNTGSRGWRCLHDASVSPVTEHAWGAFRGHVAVGAGEQVDAAACAWGWSRRFFPDRDWDTPVVVAARALDEWGNMALRHALVPDPLPQMQERPVHLVERRIRGGIESTNIGSKMQWSIGSGQDAVLLLDAGLLTSAYPGFRVSGGKGARIQVVYAESLRDPATGLKGNRDEIDGKEAYGLCDVFLPDGVRRTFTTSWFRSFRYLEVRIRTVAEPLRIEATTAAETSFPLKHRSRVRVIGKDPYDSKRMEAMTWRTSLLCSHETFFDCPHYEQAQFPGDSRVQAVYHYVAANEDRLARKAIGDFFASRTVSGLLLSHYPCSSVQVIATYSLQWIGMLHDFLLYRGGAEFVGTYVSHAREVLEWFERRIRPDGMLARIEYAPFIDWAADFQYGNAPQDSDGGSSIVTSLYAQACEWLGFVELHCGFPELAERWRRRAARLRRAVLRSCWNADRGMLADTTGARTFSQHAQVEGILAGALSPTRGRAALRRAMADSTVTAPCSLYYRYYVVQALKRCWMASGMFDQLAHWTECMVGTGLSTWPETQRENTRSDCHAWGVMPGIEFVETVLGVRPDPRAPGMSAVLLSPCLGSLEGVEGAVTLPSGRRLSVKVEKAKRGVACEIDSPVPVTIPGRKQRLRAGKHSLVIA